MTDSKQKLNQLYTPISQINHLYDYWAKCHGIRYFTFLVYYQLIEEKYLIQSQFSDRAQIPRQTVHSLIKKLEEDGMVRLEVHPSSKKEKVISLTEQGREYAEKLIFPIHDVEKQALSLLNDEELHIMTSGMERFAQHMQQEMNKHLHEKNKHFRKEES